jgi:hypothetical protein
VHKKPLSDKITDNYDIIEQQTAFVKRNCIFFESNGIEWRSVTRKILNLRKYTVNFSEKRLDIPKKR